MALRALSNHLHLFSFLLSDDTILLAHFLKHYHGQVGVRPDRTAIAIRTRDDEPPGALAATLDVLGESRLEATSILLPCCVLILTYFPIL